MFVGIWRKAKPRALGGSGFLPVDDGLGRTRQSRTGESTRFVQQCRAVRPQVSSGQQAQAHAFVRRFSTSSLVALLQASTSTSAATVALYSCMTALVLPILQAPNPRVAEYLIQVLLPALHPTQEEVSYTDEEKARYIELKEQLADVLIDVVWQLEQEIDSGVLHPPQQAPEVAADTAEDQKMDVDADAAPVKTAEDLEAERVSAERTRKAAELAQRDATDKASRERLGEFVKTLVVSVESASAPRLELMSSFTHRLPASFQRQSAWIASRPCSSAYRRSNSSRTPEYSLDLKCEHARPSSELRRPVDFDAVLD